MTTKDHHHGGSSSSNNVRYGGCGNNNNIVRLMVVMTTVLILCIGNILSSSLPTKYNASSAYYTAAFLVWDNTNVETTARTTSSSSSSSTVESMSMSSNITEPVELSLCLLIKDDNRILSEFIGYHYHTIHLRRVIVAIDPDSETTPAEILEPWSIHFGLRYTIWSDHDYMPSYFVNKNSTSTEQLPWVLGDKEFKVDPITNLTTSKYYSGKNDPSTGQPYTQQQIKDGLQKINNHRIRQRRFVSQCYKQLKLEGYTWTMHIDTDEYVVINPHLRHHPDIVEKVTPHPYVSNIPEGDNILGYDIDTTSSTTGIIVPKQPTANCLETFFRLMLQQFHHLHSPRYQNCLKIPRLLFGSKEEIEIDIVERESNDGNPQHHDNSTTTTTIIVQSTDTDPNTTNNDNDNNPPPPKQPFETLRWIYSAKLEERYNGYPKSIVNVATILDTNAIFQEPKLIDSVHNPIVPSRQSRAGSAAIMDCACEAGRFPFLPSERDVRIAMNTWKQQQNGTTIPKLSGFVDRPLIAHHYIGSLEDYMMRNDTRRTPEDHRAKAKHANSRKDDQWMMKWIDLFIQDHGREKVQHVLGQYQLPPPL